MRKVCSPRSGEEAAIIRARLAHGGREVLAEVQLNRSGANRAQVNRSAIKVRELPRYFSSVLFAPEDLAIVAEELPKALKAKLLLVRIINQKAQSQNQKKTKKNSNPHKNSLKSMKRIWKRAQSK